MFYIKCSHKVLNCTLFFFKLVKTATEAKMIVEASDDDSVGSSACYEWFEKSNLTSWTSYAAVNHKNLKAMTYFGGDCMYINAVSYSVEYRAAVSLLGVATVTSGGSGLFNYCSYDSLFE